MKRGLSLVLSVLLVMGLLLGGGLQAPAWAGSEKETKSTPTAPATPTGLTATAVDHQQIIISWSPSDGATGYRLYSGSTELSPLIGTTFSHDGLAANTQYSYTVLAYNDAGESPLSSVVYQTTKTAPVEPPAAPTNLAASPLSAASIRLTWTKGSGIANGFVIQRKTSGGSYVDITTINDGNAVSFDDTGLTANTTYYYQIRAFNSGGTSPYSNEANAATPQAVTTPAQPTDLTAASVGATSVTLTWQDKSNNETGFRIERKTGSGSFLEVGVVNANITTFTNSGLSTGTTYTYRVRATNAAGNSAFSNEVTVTTASLPANPDNLRITATGTDRLTISWRDNANNEKGFRIERKTGSGSYAEIATVSANTTSYTNTGLSNNTTYTYRVRAYNDAGNSAYSNEATAKTGVVLARPENLEASAIGTDRVTLTWRDRSSNEKGFIIERKTGTGSFTEIATVRANTTTYTDTRLKNNTTYTYRIQAYNDDGRSEFSEELKVTTGTVPAKPEDLKITLVSTDRIRIEWRDRSDNETGFRIERRTGNGSFTEIETVRANVTTFTNTGLRNRTEYTYRVRAYNETGNSPYSNEVSAVTGQVPEAPDRLTVTSEDRDRVTLSWRDRSDNETGFILERKTGSGSFATLATLSANTTSYTDRNLTEGQRYTYRVKAFNDSGESNASNEVSAQTQKEIVTRLTIGSTQYRVDGQLKQMDAAPVIVESRTLLPIRYVAEAIGATVLWDAQAQKVTVLLDGRTVELWVGSSIARVNGVSTQIDARNSQVMPLIVPPGRTMMPLRFIAESLGCDVQWNERTQEVTVVYPAM